MIGIHTQKTQHGFGDIPRIFVNQRDCAEAKQQHHQALGQFE